MGLSSKVLTTDQFAERMKACRLKLINDMPFEINLQSLYPGGRYICDLKTTNQYFSMTDMDRLNPWMTYQRIINAMGDLVRCAEWYQGRQVYYNLFEVWTPAESPKSRRVQGVWLQQEPESPLNANGTRVASA